MVELSKIVELSNYKKWSSLKKEFIKSNKIPQITNDELILLGDYKIPPDENIISYKFLEHAKILQLKKEKIKIIPDMVRLFPYKGKSRNSLGHVFLRIEINSTIVSSLTNINAYYNCIECDTLFRVECNPQKWFKYFDGPVCKKVKEKWLLDQQRIKKIRNKGYQVLIIWEQDWKKSSELTKQKIRNFLNESNNTFIL